MRLLNECLLQRAIEHWMAVVGGFHRDIISCVLAWRGVRCGATEASQRQRRTPVLVGVSDVYPRLRAVFLLTFCPSLYPGYDMNFRTPCAMCDPANGIEAFAFCTDFDCPRPSIMCDAVEEVHIHRGSKRGHDILATLWARVVWFAVGLTNFLHNCFVYITGIRKVVCISSPHPTSASALPCKVYETRIWRLFIYSLL